MLLRLERPDDILQIEMLITSAFLDAPHGDGREAAIVETLRREGALSVSLVAEADAAIVGHIAFSRVQIDGQDCNWFGLGPIAVAVAHRRRGIGAALIETGLRQIRECGAEGCVVLGDPGYYGRFGFKSDPELCLAGVPAEYFMRLSFSSVPVRGMVGYHAAFFAT